jgi:hypothetical protein
MAQCKHIIFSSLISWKIFLIDLNTASLRDDLTSLCFDPVYL